MARVSRAITMGRSNNTSSILVIAMSNGVKSIYLRVTYTERDRERQGELPWRLDEEILSFNMMYSLPDSGWICRSFNYHAIAIPMNFQLFPLMWRLNFNCNPNCSFGPTRNYLGIVSNRYVLGQKFRDLVIPW